MLLGLSRASLSGKQDQGLLTGLGQTTFWFGIDGSCFRSELLVDARHSSMRETSFLIQILTCAHFVCRLINVLKKICTSIRGLNVCLRLSPVPTKLAKASIHGTRSCALKPTAMPISCMHTCLGIFSCLPRAFSNVKYILHAFVVCYRANTDCSD